MSSILFELHPFPWLSMGIALSMSHVHVSCMSHVFTKARTVGVWALLLMNRHGWKPSCEGEVMAETGALSLFG